MKSGLEYFQLVATPALPSKTQRCLRAAQIVAGLWQVLAAGILFVGLEPAHRDRLRPWGIGALLVSAGIYSLLLPMYYILREPKKDSDA